MLWVKEKGKGDQKCQDQHTLAHSVKKYLLSTYCVPGGESGKMDGVTTLLELMVAISTETRKSAVDGLSTVDGDKPLQCKYWVLTGI